MLNNAKFDEKSGYLTVTQGKRVLKFRVRPDSGGLATLQHHEDSRPWSPPRTASAEEVALWDALLDAHSNLCDTGNSGDTSRESPAGRECWVKYWKGIPSALCTTKPDSLADADSEWVRMVESPGAPPQAQAPAADSGERRGA